MAKAKLADFVSEDEAGWRFDCPIGTENRSCGAPVVGGANDGGWVGFSSTHHVTKAHALARFEQHVLEHRDGTRMPEMSQFVMEQGIKEFMANPQDRKVIAVTPQDLIGEAPKSKKETSK